MRQKIFYFTFIIAIIFSEGVSAKSFSFEVANESVCNSYGIDNYEGAPEDFAVLPSGPFECATELYQVVDGKVLKRLDPATGIYETIGTASVNYNGAGFNVEDNYIYGISSGPILSRIDNQGNQTSMGSITGFTALSYSGDFDLNGNWWSFEKSGSSSYIVNKLDVDVFPLTVEPFTYTVLAGEASQSNCADVSYNAFTGKFYGMNSGKIHEFDIENETARVIADYSSSSESGSYGAVWSDVEGNTYFFNNSTGNIYKASFSANGEILSYSQVSVSYPNSSNDGMGCPIAEPPVFAEFCGNGLDDDNDGLIDCEDPDCNAESDCGRTLEVTLSINSEACAHSIVPYHIWIVNAGSEDANDVTVNDNLPMGFSFAGDTICYSAGASNDSLALPQEWDTGTLTWSGLQIPAGDSIMISYSALVDENIGLGDYPNNVTIENAHMSPETVSGTYSVTNDKCEIEKFECEPAFYQVYKRRSGPNTFGKLVPETGEYELIAYISPQANGLGYDRENDYAYGSNGKRFIRLDKSGVVTYMNVMFNNKVYVGDTDTLGNWWGNDGNDMCRIDLSTMSLTRFSGQRLVGWDMAYNDDGHFYSVHKNLLYRFNTDTYQREVLGYLTGDEIPNKGHGAQWMGENGYLYISNNSTGKIFRVDVEAQEARLVMISESGLRFNDGFACPAELPPVYDFEYSDNSNYESAYYLTYAQDLIDNDEPDYFSIWAGALVTADDTDPQNATATGDNGDDGFTINNVFSPGQTVNSSITLSSNVDNRTGYYGLWIDWNDDGEWDDFYSGSENIVSAVTTDVPITVPNTFAGGDVAYRLRVSDVEMFSADHSGLIAEIGEVEDYILYAGVNGEICGNCIDDDGDGLADCSDPDCAGIGCGEICHNGLDDDGDGRIDEEDESCDPDGYQNCFDVNSNSDGADAIPGDGICDDGNGNCTLRAAIEEANATAGSNCISFSTSGDILCASELPYITESVLIDGMTAPGYVSGSPSVSVKYSAGNALTVSEAMDVEIRGLDLSHTNANNMSNYGVVIASSASVYIHDNVIKNRIRAIHANESSDIIVTDNDLRDSGSTCWDGTIYIRELCASTIPGGLFIEGNTFGGIHLEPLVPINISDAENIIVSDGSVENTNIVFDGVDKYLYPLRFIDVNNSLIKNVDLSHNDGDMVGFGIWMISCNNIEMDNVTAKNRTRAVNVRGGNNLNIHDCDFRDSGLNADNGMINLEDFFCGGPADLQVKDVNYGDLSQSVSTLLNFMNCENIVISDGTAINTNIEFRNDLPQATPIRLFNSREISIMNLDFTYEDSNYGASRAIWIQEGSENINIEQNYFQNRSSAVHVQSGFNITMTCNTATRNNNAILIDDNSTFSLLENNNFGCNAVAVHQRGTEEIQAKNNYWGHSEGSSSSTGQGDYYIGSVVANEFKGQQSTCTSSISAMTCLGEICDNGIDDDGDGVIDCDDSSCLGLPSCGGANMVVNGIDCGNFLTFDESRENWYMVDEEMESQRLIGHSDDSQPVLGEICDFTFIPESPTGTPFVYAQNRDNSPNYFTSPPLLGLDAQYILGGMLEWYWWTGYPDGRSVTNSMDSIHVVLTNIEGESAHYYAPIENPGQWELISIPLQAMQWGMNNTSFTEILSSLNTVSIQVEVTDTEMSNQCADNVFFAIDDIIFCQDTDMDGVSDNRDLCPYDPDKIEPGNCDCGTPDLDETGMPNCDPESQDEHALVDYEYVTDEEKLLLKSLGKEVKSKVAGYKFSVENMADLEEEEPPFRIYPNPTNGIFFIKLEEDIDQIVIMDQTGRVVKRSMNVLEGRFEVDLNLFSVGIYIVEVSVDGQSWKRRLMIK